MTRKVAGKGASRAIMYQGQLQRRAGREEERARMAVASGMGVSMGCVGRRARQGGMQRSAECGGKWRDGIAEKVASRAGADWLGVADSGKSRTCFPLQRGRQGKDGTTQRGMCWLVLVLFNGVLLPCECINASMHRGGLQLTRMNQHVMRGTLHVIMAG